MLLDVRDLHKSFPGATGPTSVLNGLSLTVKAGEILALTGESGSGKSTLLHIVAGLEPLDRGSIQVDGREVTTLDDSGRAELRRDTIGIVFQQFNLIPSLTVGQNLGFQARLAKRTLGQNLNALADQLGLTDHMAKYPEELSGGQQQRLAIGRAIAAGPRLLLADEPTGNLDEDTADAVFALLLELARDHDTGLLIATHSAKLAAQTDRHLHLSRGQVA